MKSAIPLLLTPFLAGIFPVKENAQSHEEPPRFAAPAKCRDRSLNCVKNQNGKAELLVTEKDNNNLLLHFIWPDADEVIAALSPDGRTVAAASWHNLVFFFDIATGKPRHYRWSPPKEIPTLPVSFVKFSLDGRRVVIASVDGVLRILSVKDGRVLSEIQETDTSLGNVGPFVKGVAFSPDGKILATAKPMNVLSLWEVATGQLIRQQRGEKILFSPDNELVRIVNAGTVDTHDLYSGEMICEHKRHYTIRECARPGRTAKFHPLDERSLEEFWKDLGGLPVHDSEDWMKIPITSRKKLEEGKSGRAYKAIGKLIADPEQSLPFLKKRLEAVASTSNIQRLDTLIAELDNHEFSKRQAASRQLATMGPTAAPAIRIALDNTISPEARRRLEQLLQGIDEEKPSSIEIAHIRAIQVLEHIGTNNAKDLLKMLAQGAQWAHRTRDAREALQRIEEMPKMDIPNPAVRLLLEAQAK